MTFCYLLLFCLFATEYSILHTPHSISPGVLFVFCSSSSDRRIVVGSSRLKVDIASSAGHLLYICTCICTCTCTCTCTFTCTFCLLSLLLRTSDYSSYYSIPPSPSPSPSCSPSCSRSLLGHSILRSIHTSQTSTHSLSECDRLTEPALADSSWSHHIITAHSSHFLTRPRLPFPVPVESSL